MNRRSAIRRIDLTRVFLRSFLIQASWSFDRMQSLGFAYAMQPALRRLYSDPEEYRRRLAVHMEYFNTQPYLASFILGAAVRAEEERVSGNSSIDVSVLKNTLMAPLGAIGDSFFWGALKPFAVMFALAVAITGAVWAPLLFLALFNVWHIAVRAGALLSGYRHAGDVVPLIARYRFTRMARRYKAVSLMMVGGLLGMTPLWRTELQLPATLPGPVTALIALLITLALASAVRTGGSPLKFMLGLAAACIALAYAGVAS